MERASCTSQCDGHLCLLSWLFTTTADAVVSAYEYGNAWTDGLPLKVEWINHTEAPAGPFSTPPHPLPRKTGSFQTPPLGIRGHA